MTEKGLYELSSAAAKKHLADHMCPNSALPQMTKKGMVSTSTDGTNSCRMVFKRIPDIVVTLLLLFLFLGGGVCVLALVLSILMRIFTSDLFSGKMELGCEGGG